MIFKLRCFFKFFNKRSYITRINTCNSILYLGTKPISIGYKNTICFGVIGKVGYMAPGPNMIYSFMPFSIYSCILGSCSAAILYKSYFNMFFCFSFFCFSLFCTPRLRSKGQYIPFITRYPVQYRLYR